MMNGKSKWFLSALVLLLVWPASVLTQEKKPSPPARPSDEKKESLSQKKKPRPAVQAPKDVPSKQELDALDELIAKRKAEVQADFAEQKTKERRSVAACENLSYLFDMTVRIQDKEPLTEQDRKRIEDGARFSEEMNKLEVCANENTWADGNKSSGARREIALLATAYMKDKRMEYLEGHVHELAAKYNDLESREHGLIAKYNDLVDDYNQLLTLAKGVANYNAEKETQSRYSPWLNLLRVAAEAANYAPIRGPVVCIGSTTAMGQGITSTYVRCD